MNIVIFLNCDLFVLEIVVKPYCDGCLCSLTLGPQNIARTNLWKKHITYSRLYLFKIKTWYLFKYLKSYLERPCHSVQSKWNGFSSSYIFVINKRNGKNFMVKYIQYLDNFTVVPKYKKMFLHMSLKLVPFAPDLPVHSLSFH